MSQHTTRPDTRARSEDEDAAIPRVPQPEHKRRVRPRQPVDQPAGDGGLGPDDPGEPDDGEFELIGDNDLGPADLAPADPNAVNPDADSGRIRK